MEEEWKMMWKRESKERENEGERQRKNRK